MDIARSATTNQRPPAKLPVWPLIHPIMAGPANPPRLPIELMIAMPVAAAGPERNKRRHAPQRRLGRADPDVDQGERGDDRDLRSSASALGHSRRRNHPLVEKAGGEVQSAYKQWRVLFPELWTLIPDF